MASSSSSSSVSVIEIEDDNSLDSQGSHVTIVTDFSNTTVPDRASTSSGDSSTDISRDDPFYIRTDVTVPNFATNLCNRELYGYFSKGLKSKTNRPFKKIPDRCKYAIPTLFSDLPSVYHHVLMGFTRCGKFFLSITENQIQAVDDSIFPNLTNEYEMHIWRFIPGQKLKQLSKHKIFSHYKETNSLEHIMFMQYPGDMYKVVCYGYNESNNPESLHITIITLPTPENCMHCVKPLPDAEEFVQRGWCPKHGFVLHYVLLITLPAPVFDPYISLSFPDHLVINTGHHIHVLNVSTEASFQSKDYFSLVMPEFSDSNAMNICSDSISEFSESPSDRSGQAVVDAILEDFSEYDLDSSEGNKPFHELNISCEPLNVTGKSYHNTLVQNIFDPRIKRLQNTSKDYIFTVPNTSTQKQPEKNKVLDKKIAEKTYEFTEENEKYEKISLFRKKRLADKKYEFSEDNTENIVPFHILRRERRYLHRAQGRSIRSAEFNSLFLSPRSPGWRSPMQSPSSRNGQFSPIGARHIYCTSVRNSPYYPKSPISPKDSTRKVNIYSQGLEVDCSDSDSRLVLRTPINCASSNLNLDSCFNQSGLLVVDPSRDNPKWIRKTVRRYGNGDFENGSLLSGHSRDDYNYPTEVPLLVQSLTDQPMDVVPDSRTDNVTIEREIIVTQRVMDFEQFVYKEAQRLCNRSNLQFKHLEDYDVKIVNVCALGGEVLSNVDIKIGASKTLPERAQTYYAHFAFVWNLVSNKFDIIDPEPKLYHSEEEFIRAPPTEGVPKFHTDEVRVLSYEAFQRSKYHLRDPQNNYEFFIRSEFSDSGPEEVTDPDSPPVF